MIVVPVVAAVLALAPHAGPQPDPALALIDRLTDVSQSHYARNNETDFPPLVGRIQSPNSFVELVRLGPAAVPALLAHLTDERPTKIVHRTLDDRRPVRVARDGDPPDGPPGDWEYAVSVGDLCCAAVGQIVNRRYGTVGDSGEDNWTIGPVVTCVPQSKRLRERMAKRWGGLTPAAHRESLVRDLLDSDDWSVRRGAAVRLGFYHPAAAEAAALEFLARPAYPAEPVERLLQDWTFRRKSAAERRAAVADLAARHGELAREGLRCALFDVLARAEAMTEDQFEREVQRDSLDSLTAARDCLVDVFGLPAAVSAADRPAREPLTRWEKACLVDDLWHVRSDKLDRAAADLLAGTETETEADRYLRRLVGRGRDAAVEAYLKRPAPPSGSPSRRGGERERVYPLARYEAMLGWTRLHDAVDRDQLPLIAAALADGVPVNARAKDGRTALHLAADRGRPEAVAELLAAGADPNVRDAGGRTAAELAAFNGHPRVVRMLAAAGADAADVFVAATVGATDRLADLLDADPAAARATDRDGNTPLHAAVWGGHPDAVRALVAAGADVRARRIDPQYPNARNRNGTDTEPLSVAVARGRTAVAAALLDCGADPNAVGVGRRTMLHDAAEAGRPDLVALLLAHGADPRRTDAYDRTPLESAKAGHHDAAAKLLAAAK